MANLLSSWRKLLLGAAIAAAAGLLYLAVRPSPIVVEVGRASSGPMQVTLSAQGETRSHDYYVITAPAAGRLLRITLHAGDKVQVNQVVAQLAPAPLNSRERDEQLSRVSASEALANAAEQQVRSAQTTHEQALREENRNRQLAAKGFIAPQALEQSASQTRSAQAALDAARAQARAARADVTLARAGLAALHPTAGGNLLAIQSPVSGTVLRIPDASERVVTAGSPLLTVGDMEHLEIVIEMLSADAVQVKPGMPVILDGWGGNAPLTAHVRLVEPGGYTKVSALGVEEKRTRVIADFDKPPVGLGDDFRVNAQVVVWQAANVLQIPTSALFRCGEHWCTFIARDKRAYLRQVEPGRRSPTVSQIVAGLREQDSIVLFPPNNLQDGSRIDARPAAGALDGPGQP